MTLKAPGFEQFIVLALFPTILYDLFTGLISKCIEFTCVLFTHFYSTLHICKPHMHAYLNTYILVLFFETRFHHFVLTGPNSLCRPGQSRLHSYFTASSSKSWDQSRKALPHLISFSKTPRIKIVTDKKGVVSVALKRNHTVIHMGNML